MGPVHLRLHFAREQGMVLLGNRVLVRWSTWGESLQEILGLGEAAYGRDDALDSPSHFLFRDRVG